MPLVVDEDGGFSESITENPHISFGGFVELPTVLEDTAEVCEEGSCWFIIIEVHTIADRP